MRKFIVLALVLISTVVTAADKKDLYNHLEQLKMKQQYPEFYATAFMSLLKDRNDILLLDMTGEGLLYLGCPQRSLQVTNQVLEKLPDNKAALERKAELEAELEQIEARIKSLEQQIETGEPTPKALGRLASIYVGMGNKDRAAQYLEQARKLDPDFILVRLAGLAYRDRLQLPSEEGVALAKEALVRYDEGKHDEALAMMFKALELTVISSDVYDALATLMVKEQKPGAALVVLKEMMNMMPNDQVLRDAVLVSWFAEDLNGGLALAGQYEARYGEDAAVAFVTGLSLEKLGDNEGAAEKFEKAKMLNPEWDREKMKTIKLRGVEVQL